MSLMTVEEAQAKVLEGADALGAEIVHLSQASNRVLARPLVSTRTQPPFDASAMDGFAVRAADAVAGATLTVIGTAPAGHAFAGTVGTGEAVRIFTGAPVPAGADAILIQEDATLLGANTIRVDVATMLARHIRPRGIDFGAGRELIPAGTRLDWRNVSLAAAMNHATLPVVRRPLVAILATGDELVPPGSTPGPDAIVASNTFGVAALVDALGGATADLGIAPDDHDAIAGAVTRAIEIRADILVTLGGASVGDLDLVKPVLGVAGMTLDFWKIAMRPGKPLLSGHLGPMRVLGLPGNPVSSLVCARLFLDPLIRSLLGERHPLPTAETAIAGADLKVNDSRRDYLRAKLAIRNGALYADPVDNQDSSLLSRFAVADALIVRDVAAPAVAKGNTVNIIRL